MQTSGDTGILRIIDPSNVHTNIIALSLLFK